MLLSPIQAYNFDYKFKILAVGDSSVGKTSLLNKYINNIFGEINLSTICIDFKSKNIKLDNKNIRIELWDTAGQERFHAITRSYYNSVDAILLCFDLSCKKSFINLSSWLEEVCKFVRTKIIIYLVGTKCDLMDIDIDLNVSINEFGNRNNLKYFETSAMEGLGIEKLFKNINDDIYNNIKYKKSEETILIETIDEKRECCG